MNPKKLNIEAGMKFGKLEVIREVERFTQPSGQWQRAFLCRCECGKEKRVRLSHLRHGRVISCGCEAGESHGMSKSKLYNTWRGMKNRCYCSSYAEWHLYGGRGIGMCDAWRDSFSAFQSWAMDNGFSEGLEIDRLNNDKGYSPENCRFTTPLENSHNRRVTLVVNYQGSRRAFPDVLRSLGLMNHYNTIRDRIKRGWNHTEAINSPIRQGNYGARSNLLGSP
jgi:hypothetical protein